MASQDIVTTLWRRATALTGNARAAQWVVAAALGACDDPRKISVHRRDRLVAQRARDASARMTESAEDGLGKLTDSARQLWVASRRLPRLQLEAWTLRVVEAMEEIPTARALDCSRTAMNAALEEAEATLQSLLGERYTEAVEALRNSLGQLDATEAREAIERQIHGAQKRRRWVTMAQLTAFAVCVGVLAWVGWDLLRSDRGRDETQSTLVEQMSAPMPKPAVGGRSVGE